MSVCVLIIATTVFKMIKPLPLRGLYSKGRRQTVSIWTVVTDRDQWVERLLLQVGHQGSLSEEVTGDLRAAWGEDNSHTKVWKEHSKQETGPRPDPQLARARRRTPSRSKQERVMGSEASTRQTRGGSRGVSRPWWGSRHYSSCNGMLLQKVQ